jgi:hypothetical protein
VEMTSPGRARRALRGIFDWFGQQRDDLIRDGLIGVIVLIAGFAFALWWEGRLADRSEIQENTRFVRQVVIDDAPLKPFRRLNLSHAALGGLDLACEDIHAEPGRASGCADLVGAKLSGADLTGADLTGADLTGGDCFLHAESCADSTDGADLSGADLTGTEMCDANLRNADLTDADLSHVYLVGADLTHADFAGMKTTRVCYDDTTTWPDGFTPARADCGERGAFPC